MITASHMEALSTGDQIKEREGKTWMLGRDRGVHYDLRRCDFTYGLHSLLFPTWTPGRRRRMRQRGSGLHLYARSIRGLGTGFFFFNLADHCDTMNY